MVERRGWANPLRHDPISPDLRSPLPRVVGGREAHQLTPFEQQRAEETRTQRAETREAKLRARRKRAEQERTEAKRRRS